MLKFKQFYKIYGLRKKNDFVFVKAIDPTTLVYPKNTVIHYCNQDVKYPNRNISYLSNINKGIIINITNLEDPEHTSYYRKKSVNIRFIITAYKKMYPDFKTDLTHNTYKRLTTHMDYSRDTRVIFNYSLIKEQYDIRNIPGASYYFDMDLYKTIIENIQKIHDDANENNVTLNQFVIQNLPDIPVAFDIIKKYLHKEDNKQLFDIFYNDRIYILNIFRNAYNSLRDRTFFKYFKDTSYYKYVNYIWYLDGKIVILNLEKLYSFDKEFVDFDNSNKYPPDKFIKLLNLFIKMFYIVPGFNSLDISSGKHEKQILDKLKEISVVKDKNIIKSLTDIDDKLLEESKKTINEDILEKEAEKNKDADNNENNEDEINVDDVMEKLTNDESLIEDLGVKEVKEETNTRTIFKSIDQILSKNMDPITETKYIYKSMLENGDINKKQYDKAMEELERFLNEESPYLDGKQIKDMLKITQQEITITEHEKELPKSKVVTQDMAKDTINVFDKKYLNNVYRKDIISTIASIQRAGLVISSYEINETDDVLGGQEEHIIKFKSVKGKTTYNIRFVLPRIRDNGTLVMSGNTYRIRKQRIDTPIKKIAYNTVALSSAYGKLFVYKAPQTKLNIGYAVKKELIKKQKEGIVSNIVSGFGLVPDVVLPEQYSIIARYIVSLKYNRYVFLFDYANRYDIIDPKKYDPDKIEANGKYIIVGLYGTKPLVIDKNNMLYIYDNNTYKKVDTLWNLLKIEIKDKHEYALLKIYKNLIPVVFILGYYLGLDNLLNLIKVRYRKESKITRDMKNDPKSIIFKLSDTNYIIYPNDEKDWMLLSGLNHYEKITKDLPSKVFNNRDDYLTFFKEIGLRLVDITNINIIETLFLDPVTINILKEMNEPTTFIGLLFRSCELLVDDYYLNPQSMKGYLIRGYDRVAQMIYNRIIQAIIEKENAAFFGSNKLVFDPYSIWRLINEDSTGILVEDINPIAYLKQKEDTTYLGIFGRSKESMAKGTREFHEDDVGVISEATKDSGDVGITAYLTANPVFKNLRGMKENKDKLSIANRLSTSALIAPFAITDDPKRVNFISIQNNHIIPIRDAMVYPIRTGYEAVLPYRLDNKFVGIAEDDGVIEKVLKDKIVVNYNKLGKKDYIYKDWTSKEESHTSWLHELVSNVTEKQKVKKGDILYYDKSFFEPDMFDPTKVIYRSYLMARTAMIESNETYEDSSVITEKIAEKASITYIKTRSIVVDNTTNISNVVKIGQEVHPTDALMIMRSSEIEDTGNLDEETLDILEGFMRSTPKAKIEGTIYNIRVFYNCDKKDLSKSIRELVDQTEKNIIDPITGKKYTGKVNSSYSIDGIPLEEGKVEIKFYIKVKSKMTTGDKLIFGNQLKSTVGEIVDYPLKTVDGRDVDALFSNRAVMARIVNSAYLMGTTASLLRLVTENAVNMYFNT